MKGALFVAASDREAEPFRAHGHKVIVAGVGRVNAAVATTLALERGEYDRVVSVGFAGALPGSGLKPGAIVVADRAVYVEEGMLGPEGFQDLAALGFPLASFFEGNSVVCDPSLWEGLGVERAVRGPIATVATCSGTDAGAAEVVARSGAIAEAMEGAAVVHAGRLLGVRGGEIRAISNQTGNRERQGWDVGAAVEALGLIAVALG